MASVNNLHLTLTEDSLQNTVTKRTRLYLSFPRNEFIKYTTVSSDKGVCVTRVMC